jgi:hypothetical protein
MAIFLLIAAILAVGVVFGSGDLSGGDVGFILGMLGLAGLIAAGVLS